MAGLGDSWGTEEELLHPRGPDGRWISKAGIAKSIFQAVLGFLQSFSPRTFQNQRQSTQYLHNISRRQGKKRFGTADLRRLYDLPNANEDLRDGVIDNPSTSKFVEMMDRTETDLPDDVILTRVVPLETFGYTTQTATGTNSDTDPGIREMSGRLIADRGYSPMTIGNVDEVVAVPPGSVRMVVAAKRGTKVNIPGGSSSDHSIFMTRDQPLRITKIKPDGRGGWTMYVTTDDSRSKGETPEAIGGPRGLQVPPTQEREAAIRDLGRISAKREGRPDEVAEQADIEARQRAAEADAQATPTPSPQQEAERKRVEALTQQPAPGEPPPRTEAPVGRVGEPGAPAPGGAPAQTPEATVPSRAVDLRLAVRDAAIPSPSAGSRRKQWNEAYLGVASGKKDPVDAVRELDSDIETLRRGGEPGGAAGRGGGPDEDRPRDIESFQKLRDLIAQEYGLPGAPSREERTQAGLPKVPRGGKTRMSQREQEAEERNRAAGASEAVPAPTPVKKAPAKKAAKKAAPGPVRTKDQEDRILSQAAKLSGPARNSEEERLLGEAEAIRARRAGAPVPTPSPVKALRSPTWTPARLKPEERRDYNDLSTEEQGEYRKFRRAGNGHGDALQSAQDAVAAKKAPAKMGGRSTGGTFIGNLPAPESEQGPDLDKMTKRELIAEAGRRGVTARESWTKDRIKKEIRDREKLADEADEQFRRDMAEELKAEFFEEEQEAQMERAVKERIPEAPAPAKKAAKKAAPALSDQETRIRELFEGDKPTVAQLREYARINGMEPGDAIVSQGFMKPLSRMKREELIGLILTGNESERRFTGDRSVGGLPNTSTLRQRIIHTPEGKRGDLLDGVLAPLTQPQRRRVAQELGVKGQGRATHQGQVLDAIMEHFRGAVPEGEGAPEAPAPVKKAAKAAVPGAAPGTAAGKITAGRLTPGMRILVGQNNGHTDRKTGAKVATITSIERFSQGGRTRSQTRIQINAVDEDGRPFIVGQGDAVVRSDRVGFSPSQTFMAAPEPGAAPAKKAAKAAAPKRMTIGEARRLSAMDAIRENEVTGNESNSWKTIFSRVSDGTWTVPRARKEAKDSARYWRESAATVRRGGGKSNPAKVEEAASRLERAADKYDKLAEDLTISQSVTKTDKYMSAGVPGAPDKVQVARERQAKIDRAKGFGNLGAEVHELIHNEVTPKELASRIRGRGKQDGLPEDQIDLLARSAEGGGQAGHFNELEKRVGELLQAEGVSLYDRPGSTVPFDRTRHRAIDGDIADGTMVHVVRPGREADIDGERVNLERTTVEPATPAETVTAERAKVLVPEGSVPGTRTDTPVDNAPRKRELRQAWIAADIQPPPGPVRTQTEEIRDRLLNGDVTPEEGIRMMESEISMNKEDLAELDAHLREADLTDRERKEFQDRAVKLTDGIREQEKASKFLRLYFKEEAPVVSLKEAKEVDPVSYEFLKDATPDDMREAAKEAGLDAPSGDTADEMFTDLLKQVARNELARRAAKKAAKKAAPAKVAKKAAPEVPRDKERVDARLLAEGIEGLSDDEIAKLQRYLDGEAVPGSGKNPTPAKIADWYDGVARRISDSTAIRHGDWSRLANPDSPQYDPEYAEQRRLEFDRGRARVQAYEELAGRVRGVRRKSVKKAAPSTPRVEAAEAKVDDLQKRIIDQALEGLQGAKSRDKGDDALEGLTTGELRRVAGSMGVKGRSKRELRDKILDRFFPETPTPEAEAKLEGQQKQAMDRLRRQSGVPETPAPRTPSLGARARAAGIDHPGETFSDVDSAVGEADRRLQGGESPTTVSRFLRERAARVAKADINEEGRRFPTNKDKDSLLSIRKSNAEYLRRVATHVQQEGKASAPAKKAAKKAAPTGGVTPENMAVLSRGGARTSDVRPKRNDRVRLIGEDPEYQVVEVMENEIRVRPVMENGNLGPAKLIKPSRVESVSPSRTGTSPVGGTKPDGPPLRSFIPNSETLDSNGRIVTRTRPNADEPVHLPNGGADQGRMHLDGELGELWQTLYFDDREPNSFVNEIARIGEQVGTGELPLATALTRLAAMKGRASDKRVADRIQKAIDGLDAPKVDFPDLPDTVPDSVREALRKLADIPTARRTDLPGTREKGSVFDQKLNLIQRLLDGDEDREFDRKLQEHELHESIDGALEMRRLFDRIDRMELMKWRRAIRREEGAPPPAKKATPRLTAIPGGGTGGRRKRPKLTVVRDEQGEFAVAWV